MGRMLLEQFRVLVEDMHAFARRHPRPQVLPEVLACGGDRSIGIRLAAARDPCYERAGRPSSNVAPLAASTNVASIKWQPLGASDSARARQSLAVNERASFRFMQVSVKF